MDSNLNSIKREIFMALLDGDDEKVMQLLAYYEQVWHKENSVVTEAPKDGSSDLTSAIRAADRRRESAIDTKVNDHIHNKEYDRARILATTIGKK